MIILQNKKKNDVHYVSYSNNIKCFLMTPLFFQSLKPEWAWIYFYASARLRPEALCIVGLSVRPSVCLSVRSQRRHPSKHETLTAGQHWPSIGSMSRVSRDSHPRLHLYTFLIFYQIEAKLWKSSDTICIIQTHTYSQHWPSIESMSRVCRDSHPRLHRYTFLVFYQIEAKLWKSSDTICIIQTHTYRPDCYYVISLRQQADKLNSHCWLSILDKPYNQITLYVTSRPGKKS